VVRGLIFVVRGSWLVIRVSYFGFRASGFVFSLSRNTTPSVFCLLSSDSCLPDFLLSCPHPTSPSQGRLIFFQPPPNLPLSGEAFIFSAPSVADPALAGQGGFKGGLMSAPPDREGCGEGFPAPT